MTAVSGSHRAGHQVTWTRPVEAVGLILRGRTARTAGPIALIVGTVLSVVNQAEVILGGHATGTTWLRIVVNYLVPFTVASVAYLSACRKMSNH